MCGRMGIEGDITAAMCHIERCVVKREREREKCKERMVTYGFRSEWINCFGKAARGDGSPRCASGMREKRGLNATVVRA